MLQRLREKAQGWFAWIILGAVALTFVLFGTSSFFESAQGPDRSIAKVNGVSITAWEVEQAYHRALQSPGNEAIRHMDPVRVKQEIVDTLIEASILRQSASHLGLVVSPEKINEILLQIPFLKDKQGYFSESLYRQFLGSANFTDASFRALIEENVLLQQLQRSIVDSAFALSADVKDYAKYGEQTRNFRYTILDKQAIEKTVLLDEAAVEQYYREHIADFLIPEAVSIDYLSLTFDDVAKQITFTDHDLESFYHEYMAGDRQGASSDWTAKKPAIIEKYQQYYAEEKFVQLAEEVAQWVFDRPDTLQPAAEKLGRSVEHTTLFTQAEGPKEAFLNRPEIITAAFSASVKDEKNNSDLIKLDDRHYIVIRMREVVPAKQKSLDSVRSEVVMRCKLAKTQALSEAKAKQTIEKLVSLPEAQALESYRWIDERGVYRTYRNMDANLLETVFSMPTPEHSNSRVIRFAPLSDGQYAIIWLTKVKDGVVESLTPIQQRDVVAELAKHWGELEFALYTAVQTEKAVVVANAPD